MAPVKRTSALAKPKCPFLKGLGKNMTVLGLFILSFLIYYMSVAFNSSQLVVTCGESCCSGILLREVNAGNADDQAHVGQATKTPSKCSGTKTDHVPSRTQSRARVQAIQEKKKPVCEFGSAFVVQLLLVSRTRVRLEAVYSLSRNNAGLASQFGPTHQPVITRHICYLFWIK